MAESRSVSDRWLGAALDYLPRWLALQLRATEQPGVSLAVAHRGRVVLEAAFGHADQARGEPLTPRHRFRVASHSKTFTAAAVMKLREQGRIGLDDRIDKHVAGLHPAVGAATVQQLLSHTAGVVRDGADSGQWQDRRPFLDEVALRADLAAGVVVEPNTRFKYSNHGFGLVGLAIESVTGERYAGWVGREIVAASGLGETACDASPMLGSKGVPFARGHSAKLPLGRRVVIPGDNPTNALASATGFVSTAADLTRFFASLDPQARTSAIAAASRREMTRRQWRDAHSTVERWYGLGTISTTVAGWETTGHSGGFQGTLTRTAHVAAERLTVSVLTNAADGPAQLWLDGALHVLAAFRKHGAATPRTRPWSGRWWSLWGPVDLLPMRDRVVVAQPLLANPMLDATELIVEPGRRERTARGRIDLAGGFASHGEPVRLVFDARGRPTAFWLGGGRMLGEARVAKELLERYTAS